MRHYMRHSLEVHHNMVAIAWYCSIAECLDEHLRVRAPRGKAALELFLYIPIYSQNSILNIVLRISGNIRNIIPVLVPLCPLTSTRANARSRVQLNITWKATFHLPFYQTINKEEKTPTHTHVHTKRLIIWRLKHHWILVFIARWF